MSKPARFLLIFLAVDALALGVYFLAKGAGPGKGADPAGDYAWVTMDAYYRPASELEEYIMTVSDEQGLLPLEFKNYGQNAAILKRFRGSKMVGAGKPVLEMTFPRLEDWAIVDLWIKGGEGRELRRTVLYILTDNAWKPGDSGRLAD
ncbi:MAG TPA: hypothetical protein PLP83_07455 [Candidatus Aminicenantes bacterium]|nr:hypothetical protein [Candidatus Aminicenantes bacterium]